MIQVFEGQTQNIYDLVKLAKLTTDICTLIRTISAILDAVTKAITCHTLAIITSKLVTRAKTGII